MDRTTTQIHKDITYVTLDNIGAPRYAELAKLWREMANAGHRERQPAWATLAAALLADDYDRKARNG